MEITVLEAKNLPAKPVMAIHAGNVRRQAKLEVNQTFVIPHPGPQCGSMQVNLFEQLGSQVLPHAAEAFCKIPAKSSDGRTSQLRLRVRRDAASPPPNTKNGAVPVSLAESISQTRDYLEQHRLQDRIQSLIQDVLREQPDNPYKHMLETLHKVKGTWKAETGQSAPPAATQAPPVAAEASPVAPQAPPTTTQAPTEAQQPMVPAPPEQPKPDGPTGRSAPKSRPVKQSTLMTPQQEAKSGRAPSKRRVDDLNAVAARFSVEQMLRGKACQEAAIYSLRVAVRRSEATAMSSLIINCVKEKLVSVAAADTLQNKRLSVAVLPNPKLYTDYEYHRALVKWASHMAFRGACKILGYKRRQSVADDEADRPGSAPGSRRQSMVPTPIVFLESDRADWGAWCK